MTEILVQIGGVLVTVGAFVGATNRALATLEKRLDRFEEILDNGLQRIASLEATRKP